ncbi:TPA: restriction endonuclease subunit S [Vibrio cholerae]|nr:restriction endonuclease subunit S [Vibrio cholerae]
MSQLNYLEKLLDGVEVEWKALGEVCDFKNGFAFKSSLFKEAGLPIIRITNVDGKNISLDDVKYFDPSDYKENTASYEISKGDILIAMSGATTGKIGFYAHESPAYLNQRVGKFLPKPKILNNRYLYHYLLSKVEQIYVIAGGGAQPNLSSNALMAKIEIPIPCPDNPEKSLAVQAEIVRVLDAFTAMTAELNMRKKQYNYYRDQLLGFEDGEVEWKTLGEVATLRRGRVMSKGYLEENSGEYPVYSSQTAKNGMIGSIDTFDFDGEFISWTTDGANAGTVFYRTGKFSITNVCGLIKINDESKLIYKYLYYWLTIEAQKHVYSGMGNPKLMSHQVEKIPVPIPCSGNEERSLNKQQRIVAILDKLEALTFSITEGLPREIELRQKQYEYYRDLLLSFPASPAGGPKSHSDEAA